MATSSTIARTSFRLLNGVVAPLVRAGVGNPLPIGAGPVMVETTGAETGEAREVPLLSVRVGDAVLVSTVRRRSNWMANLRAHPRVNVRLFGRDRKATSRVVDLTALRVAVLQLDPAG